MSHEAAEESGAGGGHDGGGMMRWLLTYADMITLLMAFFIMLYSMSRISVDKFERAAASLRAEFAPARPGRGGPGRGLPSIFGRARSARLEKEVQSIENRLKEYVEENDLADVVRTSHEDQKLVISLASDDLLFARGESDLRAPALVILGRIAGLLQEIPNQIAVEGHTCDLPISTARFPSNWELSAARASAVVRYLIERKGIAATRLAATGYADSRPAAPNTTEEGRRLNRRVDLVILAQVPEAGHGGPIEAEP